MRKRLQQQTNELAIRNTELEQQIKESTQQLDLALKAGKLGIWVWDIPTNNVHWSKSVESIFGMPRGSFDGTYEAYLALVHPDDRVILTELIQKALSGEPSYHFEHRTLLPSGEVHWLECDGQMAYEDSKPVTLSGTVRDITERKKAELALLVSEQQYRSLFEQSSDGVILHDVATGTVLAANQALADMLACEVSDLIGTSFADDVHPDEVSDAHKRWNSVLANGHLDPYERRLITHKGEARYFEITGSTINDTVTNKPRFVQVVLRDITERKQIEHQMRAALQEKEILLKEIHHRVKNNLQVVSSLLYLQSQRIPDDNLRELFHESQNRVRAMALVHEQLYQSDNFAQVDFGAYLHTLIDSLFASYGTDETQIVLNLHTNGTLLDVHTAIPCGLMVSEMVSNALKYAFPNNQHGEIAVSMRLEGDLYQLCVKDNGVGIDLNAPIRPGSLGLQLIDRLVDQVSGTLVRTGPPGVINLVQIPRTEIERK